MKRKKHVENCSRSKNSDKMDYGERGISIMEIDRAPMVVPNTIGNLTMEDIRSSVVKNEVEIESVVSQKYDKLGTR